MSSKWTALAAVSLCSVLLCVGGCVGAAIEGVKGGHVAMAGAYKETTPVAEGALAKYKGYKVGTCSIKILTVPADTKEKDRTKVQEQIDHDTKVANKVMALLPDRFNEYMVDDAKLHLGAAPALVASVKDVRVKQRKGAIGVAIPKSDVTSTVTLSDAKTGKVLGVATVYDHTSSRIHGNPRQLANFICRGTAKWINESRKPRKKK